MSGNGHLRPHQVSSTFVLRHRGTVLHLFMSFLRALHAKGLVAAKRRSTASSAVGGHRLSGVGSLVLSHTVTRPGLLWIDLEVLARAELTSLTSLSLWIPVSIYQGSIPGKILPCSENWTKGVLTIGRNQDRAGASAQLTALSSLPRNCHQG